jgi:sedoheptulokinase
MDASQAHSFGAYDFSTGDWTFESLREIGFPTQLLPEIAPTGTVIGEWRNAPGTKITSCVGDNQASVLGAAQDFWTDCILSLGTSGQISVHLSEAVSPHPAIDVRPFPGKGYLGVGASLTGGKAYQTLRDFLDQVCVRLGGTTVGAVTYQQLNELAEELLDELVAAQRDVVHDPDLPRVDTRFLGTRNNPEARASISNLTPWNFTPGGVVLGLLSGIVGELQHLFSLLPAQVRRETRRLCLSGNALRRNTLLRRLAELHFQLPGYVPTYSEEAAVGAALIAGVGVGIWPNYDAACRSVG